MRIGPDIVQYVFTTPEFWRSYKGDIPSIVEAGDCWSWDAETVRKYMALIEPLRVQPVKRETNMNQTGRKTTQ